MGLGGPPGDLSIRDCGDLSGTVCFRMHAVVRGAESLAICRRQHRGPNASGAPSRNFDAGQRSDHWCRERLGRKSSVGALSGWRGVRGLVLARRGSAPAAVALIREAVAMAEETHRVAQRRQVEDEDVDPGDTAGYGSEAKPRARELLQQGIVMLSELQERLYAQSRWGMLLIFQAMDAAGKDSAIKHVMSGVNPQGCQVYSFKTPSAEDLSHDYLWRTTRCLPERGRIGIFNRSYYEEVLVVRVHPELLDKQRLPPEMVTKDIWDERYEDINNHERYLARNGYVIRKFFLHLSKKEQRKRFLSRLDESAKNWKFSVADARERQRWDDYMSAYSLAITNCSTPTVPWYLIPADDKNYRNWAVSKILVETLREMNPQYPQPKLDIPRLKKRLQA